MIYIAILILLIILSYNYDYQKKDKGKSFWFNTVLIILILVAGLRYRLGVDTIRYEMSFSDIPTLSNLIGFDFDKENYDPLYLILSSLARTISSEFWVMQLLQAILVNTVIFRFIKLNTKNIFLGALLYYVCLYLNFMCEVMRESCAVSMLLLGYEYLKQNNIFKFTIFVILAYLFHSTAIVLFAIPLLKLSGIWDNMCLNRYSILVFTIVLIVGYYLQDRFIEYIEILSISERISNKAEIYSDSALIGNSRSLLGATFMIISRLLPAYMWGQLTPKVKSRQNIEPLIMLCCIFIVMSTPINILYRYMNYFMPFLIVAVSDCMYLKCPNIKSLLNMKVCRFFIVLLMMSIYVSSLFSSVGNIGRKGFSKYYPYSSIVDKTVDEDREMVLGYYIEWY